MTVTDWYAFRLFEVMFVLRKVFAVAGAQRL